MTKQVSLAKASAIMGKALVAKPKAKRATKAKATKKAERQPNMDEIVSVVVSRDGGYIVVSNRAGDNLARPRNGDSKEFREFARKGGSFSKLVGWHNANPAPKPQAKLARGIGAGDAPQSAAAVRAQKPAKAEKKPAAPKAAKNKQPSRGVERTYTVGSKKNEANKESWRYHMLAMIMKHTSTEKAKAAHAKSGKFSANKLDFNWANAQGYIKFTK